MINITIFSSPRLLQIDNQLATSLLITSNRLLVNKLSQAMRTHPGIGLLWQVCCKMSRIFWLCRVGTCEDVRPRCCYSGLTKKINQVIVVSLACGSLIFSIVIKCLETLPERSCSLTCNNFKHGWFGIFCPPNLFKIKAIIQMNKWSNIVKCYSE